ncbi:MAG: helix-turn-helix domain-containing protein [Cypionkella sp.]
MENGERVSEGNMNERVVPPGQRIKLLRGYLQWNQKELLVAVRSAGLTMSQSKLSKFESGTQEISRDEARVLANILQTTPAYLLGLTDDPRNQVDAEEDLHGEALRKNWVVYEGGTARARLLARQLLDVFAEMSDAEREYVIKLAEDLRRLTRPRVIGGEEGVDEKSGSE